MSKKKQNRQHHDNQHQAVTDTNSSTPSRGTRIATLEARFEGPIPHPIILEGYERVLPGAADRILTMAENQAQHRQQMESSVVQSNITHERVGMNYAFILTLLLMGTGFYLIINDKDTAGYFAIFGPVVFSAASYVYSKFREREVSKKDDSK